MFKRNVTQTAYKELSVTTKVCLIPIATSSPGYPLGLFLFPPKTYYIDFAFAATKMH